MVLQLPHCLKGVKTVYTLHRLLMGVFHLHLNHFSVNEDELVLVCQCVLTTEPLFDFFYHNVGQTNQTYLCFLPVPAGLNE